MKIRFRNERSTACQTAPRVRDEHMASSSTAASIPIVNGEPVHDHIVQGVPVLTSHDDAILNGFLHDGSPKHALDGLRHRCKSALKAVVKERTLKEQAAANETALAKREAEAQREAAAKEATLARRKAEAECKAAAKEATRARRKAEAALKAAAKEKAREAKVQRKEEAERALLKLERIAAARRVQESEARKKQRQAEQKREEQRQERARHEQERRQRAAALDRMYGKVEFPESRFAQRPGLRDGRGIDYGELYRRNPSLAW